MKRLSGMKRERLTFMLCLAGAVSSQAQTFTKLVDFNLTNGSNPAFMSLIQGGDGNLYGTTASGGTNDAGTVFKVTPAGKLTTLYSFCAEANCADGSSPKTGLTLSLRGNLYGVTSEGGSASMGTVFRITPLGKLSTVYSFCKQSGCPDGSDPFGALVLGTDGTYYGTTFEGGAGNSGTVFKIAETGKLTTLHSFNNTDGANPFAGLVQASNGNFYGTTVNGG